MCANLSAMNREPNTDRSLDQSKEERTIKLGMDVHAIQITICRQEGGLLPQPAQKMPWDKALAWIAGLVASGARVYSCYEAGPCGYSLHRQLLAMGVSNFVVVPQRLDQHCKRVKTDKSDARQLADRLDRYVRGNTAAFSVVRVPTEEQEQRRALGRQRAMVVKDLNRCIVRGHGILLAQGRHAPSGWWKQTNWARLRKTLPGWLREQLELWQAQALGLDKQLQALSLKVEALVQGKTIPKGLGTLTAALLAGEMLDWGRFKNRRQVASFTGLCPSEKSSGGKRIQGAINRHGNPRLRHLLVEAIWRLERYQPGYRPVQKLRKTTGARSRKKLATAAARRLAVDLWRIETGQCSAQQLGLKLASSLP